MLIVFCSPLFSQQNASALFQKRQLLLAVAALKRQQIGALYKALFFLLIGCKQCVPALVSAQQSSTRAAFFRILGSSDFKRDSQNSGSSSNFSSSHRPAAGPSFLSRRSPRMMDRLCLTSSPFFIFSYKLYKVFVSFLIHNFHSYGYFPISFGYARSALDAIRQGCIPNDILSHSTRSANAFAYQI